MKKIKTPQNVEMAICALSAHRETFCDFQNYPDKLRSLLKLVYQDRNIIIDWKELYDEHFSNPRMWEACTYEAHFYSTDLQHYIDLYNDLAKQIDHQIKIREEAQRISQRIFGH